MDKERLIGLYCEAWGEADAGRQRDALGVIWAVGSTYINSTVHLEGRHHLVAHIGRVIERYPGSRIELISLVDTHCDVFRFTWRKILRDGSALPEGVDFGEVSSDGLLRRIVGFFGPFTPR